MGAPTAGGPKDGRAEGGGATSLDVAVPTGGGVKDSTDGVVAAGSTDGVGMAPGAADVSIKGDAAGPGVNGTEPLTSGVDALGGVMDPVGLASLG
ncbi:MAG: hypothetical protein VYE68_06585, partial [Acidobacteriota bacterium]|nr:hypothetical protein [Acidobacteriota bacterium]